MSSLNAYQLTPIVLKTLYSQQSPDLSLVPSGRLYELCAVEQACSLFKQGDKQRTLTNSAILWFLSVQGLAPTEGHSSSHKASLKKQEKLQFRLYFPRPPYKGADYRAARGKDGLYNFVGLVLGHHGTTIQRIQRQSNAKIEVHVNC